MENDFKKQKITLAMEAFLGIMIPVNMLLYVISAVKPNANPFKALILSFISSAFLFGIMALADTKLTKNAKPLSKDEELKYRKASLILDIVAVIALAAVFIFSYLEMTGKGVSIPYSVQVCIIIVADIICAYWNFIQFVINLREYKSQQKSDGAE